MNRYFQYFFCLIIFLGLYYCEGLPPIGGLSVAQIWKFPVLLYLLYVVFRYYRNRFYFEKISYGLAFENFFCPAIINNPFSILIHASKQVPMVLFFNYWLIRFRDRKEFLEVILYTIAQYIAISSFVVLCGMITPLNVYKSAEAYGDGLQYYSGLSGSVHSASSYFCISALVLIYGFKRGRFKTLIEKIYNIFLIMVLLVSLYKAFVRTGWLMFIIGCVFLVDKDKIKFKNFYKYIISILLLALLFLFFYQSNDNLRRRLTETNVWHENDNEEVNIDGSGRFVYWSVSLSCYKQNNIYGLLFGKGIDAVREDMYKAIGHSLFSHNHFVDMLAQYGLVGFVLLILYIKTIYSFIRYYGRGSPYQKLSYIFLILYVIFAFFQSEMYFWYAIMFSISLVLMYFSGNEMYE